MGNSTYSFADLSVVLTHKAMGQLTLQGAGLGSIQFNMANDVSSQDVSADGSVMTSKVTADNGTVVLSVQQTSEAHAWLTKLYNYLKPASAIEWAGISLLATSPAMQVTHEGSHMSFQKRADKGYQAQGQQVSWTLMVGELKEY